MLIAEFISSVYLLQMTEKDQEVVDLLEKLSDQEKEFQDLQETKHALDMEIAVFRKLMETEEDRLGLSDPAAGQGDK